MKRPFIKSAWTWSESVDEVERDASACSKIDEGERDAPARWELVHRDWSARAELERSGGCRWAARITGVYAGVRLRAGRLRARWRRRSTRPAS